jgi:hypothetical protein
MNKASLTTKVQTFCEHSLWFHLDKWESGIAKAYCKICFTRFFIPANNEKWQRHLADSFTIWSRMYSSLFIQRSWNLMFTSKSAHTFHRSFVHNCSNLEANKLSSSFFWQIILGFFLHRQSCCLLRVSFIALCNVFVVLLCVWTSRVIFEYDCESWQSSFVLNLRRFKCEASYRVL